VIRDLRRMRKVNRDMAQRTLVTFFLRKQVLSVFCFAEFTARNEKDISVVKYSSIYAVCYLLTLYLAFSSFFLPLCL
jgi:hypothetical protein